MEHYRALKCSRSNILISGGQGGGGDSNINAKEIFRFFFQKHFAHSETLEFNSSLLNSAKRFLIFQHIIIIIIITNFALK